MTNAPHLTRGKQAEHAARAARSAQALRDNLQRRKEQARARERSDCDTPDTGQGKGEAAPT